MRFTLSTIPILAGRSARLVLIAATVSAVTLPEVSAQENYPIRPIRIVVPGPPSGLNDMLARLMAPELFARLGRQVIVENRAGAGTVIGNDVVAKAAPDGYTLLMCVVAFAMSPATYKKLPYDAIRDFAAITQVASVPNVMVVHPSVPAKSVQELIALARARPGEILFASSGNGTNAHLAIELFASMAQIRLVHVAYKGGPPAVIGVIAGEVALTAMSMSSLMPNVRIGKLRALGVTSARRVAAAADVPTIAEAGLPGYEALQWAGLLAPAATPRAIIARLHQEAVAVLRTPEHRERLTSDGLNIVAGSPDEFAAFIKAEIVKWGQVVKAAGIQPE